MSACGDSERASRHIPSSSFNTFFNGRRADVPTPCLLGDTLGKVSQVKSFLPATGGHTSSKECRAYKSNGKTQGHHDGDCVCLSSHTQYIASRAAIAMPPTRSIAPRSSRQAPAAFARQGHRNHPEHILQLQGNRPPKHAKHRRNLVGFAQKAVLYKICLTRPTEDKTSATTGRRHALIEIQTRPGKASQEACKAARCEVPDTKTRGRNMAKGGWMCQGQRMLDACARLPVRRRRQLTSSAD